ncbi:hypothetical protein HYN48_04360 [Flavobacterium magnum]|uniref:Uncharacterized protein n=1 Tax=Flavobacterium magnum TaxID=2162713 RepID=A0A2S0RCW7_9FLAO|nr:hypothetical protein [Flavobacterium magnum]AWA29379.1 hypothetical protein HYN48_04360 [Flavobacterium magnum]
MFRPILFFLLFTNILLSQTLLVSTPLELKKNSDFHQALNAVNEKTKDVYAFVADKETIHVLRYNNALFLRDSMVVSFPDRKYPSMLGYAFEGNSPVLFLAGDDLKKLAQVDFDLAAKSISVKTFDFIGADENFVCSFTQDNVFYAVTAPEKTQLLKLYVFGDGSFSQHTLDFSAYGFSDGRGKSLSFSELLSKFPIEKMQTESVNALASGVQKTKMFITPRKIVLTVDSNPEMTTLFRIDLHDYSVSKADFMQPAGRAQNPDLSAFSNSYYHQGRLYQLKGNGEKLTLTGTDVETSVVLQTYEASIRDTINYRNSPLWSRTGNGRPSELSVKKFFRKLAASDAGMTVYTTSGNNLLFTVGGLRETTTTGNILLGVALGAGSIAAGGGGDVGYLFDNETGQSVYFESVFDADFKHLESVPEIIADDYIAEFLESNESAAIPSVFRYKDFYILAYYDSRGRQYTLRKFADGGVE